MRAISRACFGLCEPKAGDLAQDSFATLVGTPPRSTDPLSTAPPRRPSAIPASPTVFEDHTHTELCIDTSVLKEMRGTRSGERRPRRKRRFAQATSFGSRREPALDPLLSSGCRRQAILGSFRFNPLVNCVCLSKVGDVAIDLLIHGNAASVPLGSKAFGWSSLGQSAQPPSDWLTEKPMTFRKHSKGVFQRSEVKGRTVARKSKVC